MKYLRFSLLFSMLLFSSLIFATDTYFITFIKGVIVLEKNQKQLKVGDQILSTDKLIFKDQAATAAVICPGKGRFTLSGSKSQKNAKGEFVAILKDTMLPAVEVKRLSTRTGMMTNTIEAENYLSAKDSISKGRLLIFGEGKFRFGKNAFPMNENNFFFLRYEYNGQTVNKKLRYNDDTLIIDKEIYNMDGNTVETSKISNMHLYYYKKDETGKVTSTKISALNPVFISLEEAKNEIVVLKTQLKKVHSSDQEKILNEIYSHFNSIYGKPDMEDLKKLFIGVN